MKIPLNTKILIRQGRIAPVINLVKNTSYPSINNAHHLDGNPISSIRTSCKTGKILSDGSRYAYLDLNGKPKLTKGHSMDIYTSTGSNQKKVKNIITGIIFNNIKEAAETYNLSVQALAEYARGKYSVCHGQYVFCYLDDEGKEILTEKHHKGIELINSKGKPKYAAWRVEDHDKREKKKFNGLMEMCKELGIKNKSHVKNVCDGSRNHVEGWKIAYINLNGQEELKDSHKKNIYKLPRKVICLNDKKIFLSCAEAARFYSVDDGGVALSAKGTLKAVSYPKNNEKLRFAYLNDKDEPILTPKHQESLSKKTNQYLVKKGGNEVICNSIAEISRQFELSLQRLYNYLSGKKVDMDGYEIIKLNDQEK